MRRTRVIRSTLLAAGAAGVALLGAPGTAWAVCTKDTDCRDPRICEKGVCVAPPPPPAQAPPPAAPPPAPVPVPVPAPVAPAPAPAETTPAAQEPPKPLEEAPPAPPPEPTPVAPEPPPPPPPPPAPVAPPPPKLRTVFFQAGAGVTMVAQSETTGARSTCTGSCSVELPPGGYKVGLSRDGDPPLVHYVNIQDSGTLKGEYDGRVGTHVAGIMILLGSLASGAALIATGLSKTDAACPGESYASGDCYTTNPGNAGWGVGIGVVGTIVGVLMLSARSSTEASFVPQASGALPSPRVAQPKLRWDATGIRF